MKKTALFFFILLVFISAYGEPIGVKKPSVRNLPSEYRAVFLNFFLKHYANTQQYTEGKKYSYVVKPYISSIAGTYSLCLDIYKNGKEISEIVCLSAEDAEDLSDKLFNLPEKIDFLQLNKKPETKEVFLKILTISKKFEKKLKVSSRNGDTLVNYRNAQPFKGQNVEHITVGEGIINIDILILKNREAARLLGYILNGYRIKGILIIKTY
ncbi:hypothetical protein [Persephonella sp.]